MTPAPARGGAAEPSTGSAGASTPAGGPRAAAAAGGGGGAGGGAAAAPRSGGDATAARPAVPLTPTGTYRYHLTGSESSALGDRTFDGHSTLVVDPPRRGRQHTRLSGDNGRTDQTVLAGRRGLYLVDLRLSQQGFDETFHPDQPVLLLPADARAGRSWQWRMTSTDGDYRLRATLRVADPHSTASVRGRKVSTVVVTSVLHIDGDSISMTIDQRDDATRDGLIVREHAVGDGTAYGTKFHTDTTRTLTSRPR